MNDELDAISINHTDFEQGTISIGANQHDKAVTLEGSDRVAVRVQHVFVSDPVLASTSHNDGIHGIKLP
jgi:urocanate hydratase